MPIYRNNGDLVGGIGVSGDGIDQDDLISFLGLHNAGVELGNGVGNAPQGIRADTAARPRELRLRYVSCPFRPFLDSNNAKRLFRIMKTASATVVLSLVADPGVA